MNKKHFYIFILILIIFSCNLSSKLNKYKFIKLKTIAVGTGQGEIGWAEYLIQTGAWPGPPTFTVTDKIYIPDQINRRLIIYDLNLNHIKTITSNKKNVYFHTQRIDIDEYDNIIYETHDKHLKKIDNNGNLIFILNREEVKNKGLDYNYFIFKDSIIFYDEDNTIKMVTPEGEFRDTMETKIFITKIRNEYEDKKIKTPKHKRKRLKHLEFSRKHIIINDTFYSRSFYDTQKYFDEIKTEREYINSITTGNKNSLQINFDKCSTSFIDYDKDGNSY